MYALLQFDMIGYVDLLWGIAEVRQALSATTAGLAS